MQTTAQGPQSRVGAWGPVRADYPGPNYQRTEQEGWQRWGASAHNLTGRCLCVWWGWGTDTPCPLMLPHARLLPSWPCPQALRASRWKAMAVVRPGGAAAGLVAVLLSHSRVSHDCGWAGWGAWVAWTAGGAVVAVGGLRGCRPGAGWAGWARWRTTPWCASALHRAEVSTPPARLLPHTMRSPLCPSKQVVRSTRLPALLDQRLGGLTWRAALQYGACLGAARFSTSLRSEKGARRIEYAEHRLSA